MAEYRKQHISFLKEKMIDDPELAKTIYKIMKNLKRKLYNPQIVIDSIFQCWKRFEVDELDAFFFAKIYAGIITGKIGLIEIEMYKEPRNNNMSYENNNILSSLPYPFSAKFEPTNGCGYNDDGSFEWKTKINFEVQFHSKQTRINKTILVEPKIIPLEIGYTKAITTYFHIVNSGGVARYPYNHTKIIIFFNNGVDYYLSK